MKLHAFEIPTVNLNEAVAVRLTEQGYRIMADIFPQSRFIPNLPGGFCRFQLWELMEMFGPKLCNGGEIPFEDNEIFLIGDVEESLRKAGAR